MDMIYMVISIVLVVSEAASAVVQILYPNNKGVSGFLAGLIKVLQVLKKSKQDPKPE